MVSRPIPLSVPVDKEEAESIDELLHSIRQLVSAPTDGDDIIDLRRPIQEKSSEKGSCEEKPWDLSEKTLSQSTQVLSSFVRTLNAAASGEKNPGVQSHSSAQDAASGRQSSSGICLEDLVAQCLRAPLDRWIRDNSETVLTMVQQKIHHKTSDLMRLWVDESLSKLATELLRAWMDENLSKMLKDSIDRQLACLVEMAKKNPQ